MDGHINALALYELSPARKLDHKEENNSSISDYDQSSVRCRYNAVNKMAWQWAETLMEIRGTVADIRGTTK